MIYHYNNHSNRKSNKTKNGTVYYTIIHITPESSTKIQKNKQIRQVEYWYRIRYKIDTYAPVLTHS